MLDLKKVYGWRLRKARKEKGLNQEELAGLLGEKTQQKEISRYENGHLLPTDDRRQQLASILGKPLYWFYMDNEGNSVVSEANMNRTLKPLNTSWRDSELKEAFIQTEKGLSKLRALMEARGIL